MLFKLFDFRFYDVSKKSGDNLRENKLAAGGLSDHPTAVTCCGPHLIKVHLVLANRH